MQTTCFIDMSVEELNDHLFNRAARNMAGDADDAVSPHCHRRQCRSIIPRVYSKMVWCLRYDRGDLIERRAFLGSHNVRNLRQPQRRIYA
ncbi:hypothetical protein D3C81_1507630 [compost metagenome]